MMWSKNEHFDWRNECKARLETRLLKSIKTLYFSYVSEFFIVSQ